LLPVQKAGLDEREHAEAFVDEYVRTIEPPVDGTLLVLIDRVAVGDAMGGVVLVGGGVLVGGDGVAAASVIHRNFDATPPYAFRTVRVAGNLSAWPDVFAGTVSASSR